MKIRQVTDNIKEGEEEKLVTGWGIKFPWELQ
jgi:hypothetical protein